MGALGRLLLGLQLCGKRVRGGRLRPQVAGGEEPGPDPPAGAARLPWAPPHPRGKRWPRSGVRGFPCPEARGPPCAQAGAVLGARPAPGA